MNKIKNIHISHKKIDFITILYNYLLLLKISIMTLQLKSNLSILDRDLSDDDSSDSDNELPIQKNLMITNPFFSREKMIINNKFTKFINLNQKEIRYNYNRVFIICQKKNGNINDSFYNEKISTQDLDNFIQNLTLVEGNMKMLCNNVHQSSCVLVDNCYLYLFKNKIEFEEKELILPLINLGEDEVRLYIKQYDGIFNMKDYVTSKVINNFYQNKDKFVCSFNSNIINMLDETNYWSKNINTQLNITNKFINRGFNLSLNQRIKDTQLKTVLQEVENMPREGDEYLGFLYRKKKYIDISSIIKKNGYTLYRITDSKYSLNEDKLNFLLNNITNNYELYKLFCNLLISKDYCHLVLNNRKMLDNINGGCYDKRFEPINLFKKYIIAFKYAIGYSWLSFYIEESIKKSRIVDDDRFVFSINTANKLPSFPILYDDIHKNPYLPILISKEILDIKNNCIGVTAYKGDYGVVTLNEFKNNLNTFLCSNKNIDLLKDVNWNNLAISGSVIPACITKFNPLEKLFPTKDRYFMEYYSKSDVDVMCNIQDNFKYIDKAYEFYETIKNNFINISQSQSENNITLRTVKTAAIIINETFIRKYIVQKQTKFTYDYIFTHLDDKEITSIFYEHYVKWKLNDNENYMLTEEWTNNKYNNYFNIVPKEDIVIIFARTNDDWKKYWNNIKQNQKIDKNDDVEKDYFNAKDQDSEEKNKDDYNEKDQDNILFKCHENLKYKIESKYINHNFEFFKTRYDGSFFSTVSQFHLPCVRGFYNGNDVKLLPSCISAAMTLINIDYKYFAGSRDPIEIINKYRMRGYGTILNDSEKIRLVSYSNKVEKWNKLYGFIKTSDTNSITNVFGPKNVNDTLFMPRFIMKELYTSLKPVTEKYNQITDFSLSTSETESYGVDINKVKLAMQSMKKLVTINSYGYINKVQKWYFDYIYENF